MKKMTRMVLISAVFVTSGLTAKIANENYKAAITNDERIHKAYELAKKPNKAAVLEAIMDATKAESDERIQKAVVLEPEEPKMVRIKTKVTTSAGVSPIASVMDKKTINKAEEFIEKITHPADVVMGDILGFSPENIPDRNVPVQELKYETKNIFPEFEDVAEEIPLTYKIILPLAEWKASLYKGADSYIAITSFSNLGVYWSNNFGIEGSGIILTEPSIKYGEIDKLKYSKAGLTLNEYNTAYILDYSGLAAKKNDTSTAPAKYSSEGGITYKELYEAFSGIEDGTYAYVENYRII